MKKLACILALLTCACSTPSILVQRPFKEVKPISFRVAQPELGKLATAQIGDPMIWASNCTRKKAIDLKEDLKHEGISIGSFSLTIPKGKLAASGESSGGTFYESEKPLTFFSNGYTAQVKGGVFIHDAPNEGHEIYWHATDTNVPLVDKNPNITYKNSVHDEWREDSFKRELIYNGRSGGMIKLLYREFSDNFIRPGFTQEISYDLIKGEIIGFKGWRFKVVDADNISITYSVVQHYN